jgi:uncharacterized protein (TIGR02145 family)
MKTPPPIRKKEFQIEYFVILNDEQKGPFDLEKMKVLLEFNNINENTLVWKEGMEDWDTISKLEEFTNQITSKIVSDANINSKSEEIADQIAPKIVPEANINPKSEEIADQIAPKIVPEPIINSKPKEKIILDSTSKEMKNTVSSMDYIKWVKFISVIVLITSLLSLIGAIQQYFQFENTKEFDTSYIGPFSAWGALISFVLGIACIIYLYRKKISFYNSIFSVLLALSAFILINVVQSNYRKFWMPYWSLHQYALSDKEENIIRNGYRTGKIDLDSMNVLIQMINIEHSRKIGTQIWKIDNLNVDRFRNGDIIPEARTTEEWLKAGENKEPAWCYYDNDTNVGQPYGKLYNWYAVNDPRGLAPEGWHIPSKDEFQNLIDFLGGGINAKSKLKSPIFWDGNDNVFGFNAVPGGERGINVEGGFNTPLGFQSIYESGGYWSSTVALLGQNDYQAWYLGLRVDEVLNYWFKNNGFSVRLIKD